MKPQDIIKAIRALTTPEYQSIRSQLNSVTIERSQELLNSFSPGEFVRFNARGRTIYGKVVKINTKRLKIKTTTMDGKPTGLSETWTVSPGLVARMANPK